MWQVLTTGRARKQKDKLPKNMKNILYFQEKDLTARGSELIGWFDFGKIVGKKDVYHCHLNKGKPRYVTIWKITDREIRLIEVRYVGIHENADYEWID